MTSHPSWLRRIVIGENPRRTLRAALGIGLLALVVFRFLLLPVRVQGASMEPTYRNGSLHFACMIAYAMKDPKRGDIVVISMSGRRTMYMKRVLGLPGERVSFEAGRLRINGQPAAEDYLAGRGLWTMPEILLQADEYFVAGDNRSVEIDRHTLGSVHRNDILGRILF